MEKEILLEVRNLLSSPDKWYQGFFAADKDGDYVYETNPSAVKFCLVGAFEKIINDNYDYCNIHSIFNKLRHIIGNNNVSAWNDNPNRTHQEVLELLDIAIKSYH